MTVGDDQIAGPASVGFSTSTGDLTSPDPADALLTLAACHDLALQVARMASFELDAVSGELQWSPVAADVLGCDPDEVEEPLRRLLAPVAAVPGSLRADYELEHRVATSDGERIIQVQARGWPSTRRPERAGLFGVITDVTERRQTEQEMVDLVDRYRLLVDLSPDLIAVHEGGIVRYVNTAACRMAGASPETIKGSNILQWVQPDDIDDMLVRLAGLAEPGMIAGPTLATLEAVDGTRVKLEVLSVRTTWEGRPAFQVIMRDTSERDRAEAAMRAQGQLVAAVSDAIISLDDHETITSWNPAAERLLGWSATEAVGRSLCDLADPFICDGLGELRATFSRDGVWSGDLTLACADGSTVPVYASLAPLTSTAHGADGLVAVLSDQSERLAAEAERTRAEARFSTVVAALDEGIAVLGTDGRVQSVNSAAERILGRRVEELAAGIFTGAGLDARDDLDRVVPGFEWPVQQVLDDGRAVRDRTIGVRRPDGSRVWLRMNAHPLHGDDARGPVGRPEAAGSPCPGVVCSFADITEQRRAALELAHAATHDALTGLANRGAMRTEIDAALGRARQRGRSTPVTVLFCDLDRFKEVNDSLGHPVGDEILCTVADRIRGLAPNRVSVGRLGGDEFILVAEHLTEAAAGRLAQDIVDELCRPLDVAAHGTRMKVTIGASVGIAFSGGDAPVVADSADLLRAADIALYQAKARGRNRVEVFDPSDADPARQRLETREDLRLAIETGRLEVHYQPLWRGSADPAACTLAGFEALARWDHPVRGPQSPGDFIPLAEETGLIGALGTYVLHRACTQMARWRAQGHELYVSVNLSARQLSDPNLVSTVWSALRSSGLPAEALWLELTETALADETIDAAAVLRELAAMGVRISIDDFGTGYSSLGRLRHLPISALKVDQSFVADMTAESAPDGMGDDGVIVESTIGLAHRLGLQVIAEGVETPAQLAGLAALDCDLVQGFLLGRPVPAADALPTPDDGSAGAADR